MASAEDNGEGDKEDPAPSMPAAAKKARKAEVVEEDVEDIASVGDPAIARSGKKIVKKLYKEHKEVASLSQTQVRSI